MRLRTGMVLLLTVVWLGGCASIEREEYHHPCQDPQCSKCLGTDSYKCPRCLGRGIDACASCNGLSTIVCSSCDGSGKRLDQQCSFCSGAGRTPCAWCNGSGRRACQRCDGDGVIRCGTTTYMWVCRKCGRRFDYNAKLCPDCDRKK